MRRLAMLAVVAALLTGMLTIGSGFVLAAEPQTTGLQQTTATAEATVDTTAEATVDTTAEATVDTTAEATVDTTAEATEDAEEGTATTAATAAGTATTTATTGSVATSTTGSGSGGTARPGQLPTTAGEDNSAATLVLIAVALGVLGAGLALRRRNGR